MGQPILAPPPKLYFFLFLQAKSGYFESFLLSHKSRAITVPYNCHMTGTPCQPPFVSFCIAYCRCSAIVISYLPLFAFIQNLISFGYLKQCLYRERVTRKGGAPVQLECTPNDSVGSHAAAPLLVARFLLSVGSQSDCGVTPYESPRRN